MAKAGDVYESPDFGERIRIIKTAADTNGRLLEMEATYTPNQTWDSGVDHFHPEQDEQFEVLEGMISIRLDGQERTYVAGENFAVPRGTVHNMRNLSNAPARVRWQVRPALNSEEFYETVWGLSAAGKLQEGTLEYILRFAILARTFDRVFRVATPPRAVQRVIFPLLALLGRLRGYAVSTRPEMTQRSASQINV